MRRDTTPESRGGSDLAAAEIRELPGDLVAAYERDWEWIMDVADEVGIGDQFGLDKTCEFDDQPANALSTLFAGMATRFSEDVDTTGDTYVHFNYINLILYNINLISHNINFIE